MSPVTVRLAAVLGARLNRPRPARAICPASRWAIAGGCTDGHGHASCPRCQRPDVRVTRLAGHAVRLARHHLAPEKGLAT